MKLGIVHSWEINAKKTIFSFGEDEAEFCTKSWELVGWYWRPVRNWRMTWLKERKQYSFLWFFFVFFLIFLFVFLFFFSISFLFFFFHGITFFSFFSFLSSFLFVFLLFCQGAFVRLVWSSFYHLWRAFTPIVSFLSFKLSIHS